jgi:hypothetical protein
VCARMDAQAGDGARSKSTPSSLTKKVTTQGRDRPTAELLARTGRSAPTVTATPTVKQNGVRAKSDGRALARARALTFSPRTTGRLVKLHLTRASLRFSAECRLEFCCSARPPPARARSRLGSFGPSVLSLHIRRGGCVVSLHQARVTLTPRCLLSESRSGAFARRGRDDARPASPDTN